MGLDGCVTFSSLFSPASKLRQIYYVSTPGDRLRKETRVEVNHGSSWDSWCLQQEAAGMERDVSTRASKKSWFFQKLLLWSAVHMHIRVFIKWWTLRNVVGVVQAKLCLKCLLCWYNNDWIFFSRVPLNVILVFAPPPPTFVLLRQARFSLFLSNPLSTCYSLPIATKGLCISRLCHWSTPTTGLSGLCVRMGIKWQAWSSRASS